MLILVACLAFRPPGTVTLRAFGDVMLGRYVGLRIEREGASAVFRGVHSLVGQSDLVLGNLECCLTHAPFARQKRFLLRARPESAVALKDFGFTHLSLANNHSGDAGEVGVRDTVSELTKDGIQPLGPSLEPVIVQKNGVRIGMISFCDLPPSPLRHQQLLRGLMTLRSQCDIEIVMIHWGIESSKTPSVEQITLAKGMVDSGADLIIGSHPHVVQPIKWITSPAGKRCLVAYSLGNFVFDAPPGDQRMSVCLSVSLNRTGTQSFQQKQLNLEKGFPVILEKT